MLKLAPIILLSFPLFAVDYTSYIGGSFPGISAVDDVRVAAMTTDSSGNTYLTGSLLTNLFSTGSTNTIAFVTKIGPSGSIIFSKAFGESVSDQGTAVTVDPSGNIYVAGGTSSPDLLVSNALQATPSQMFILKLSPDGSSVLYLTYFGGGGAISGLATDSKGNLYLTGWTLQDVGAAPFPTTNGLPAVPASGLSYNASLAFFTEINAIGTQILYSGVIAPTGVPCPPVPPMASTACPDIQQYAIGVSIAVDSSGNAYVAGNTNGTTLPATNGAFATQGIGAFVVKINAGGTGIGYLTYLGSGNNIYVISSYPANVVSSLAIDSSGDVYIAGSTNDPNFPATSGAYQTKLAATSAVNDLGFPSTDAFAAKLSADGSKLVWATLLGGENEDVANSIAVDSSNNIWISGTTASTVFPNANGWSTNGTDFLTQINNTGTALLSSSRYPNQTVEQAIAIDPAGLIHAAGPTGIVSGINPTGTPTMRVFGIVNLAGGETTGRATSGEMVSIYGPHIGPAVPVSASTTSGALPTTLGRVQVLLPGSGAASLLYVSDSQINAILPAMNNGAQMQILNGGTTSPAFQLEQEAAVPGVFLAADGFAAAVNQDGTVNSATNGAAPGSLVTIWATGTGNLPITAGTITTTASNSCGTACVINIGPLGTTQASVVYAGASPGYASGFMEIVFRVPSTSDSFTLSIGAIPTGFFAIHLAL